MPGRANRAAASSDDDDFGDSRERKELVARDEAGRAGGVARGDRAPRRDAAGVVRGQQRTDWCVTARQKPRFFDRDLPESIQYACGQQERGAQGFLHWQLFIQFKSRVRLHQVQQAVGDDTCHCEPRAGTPSQARDYCRKLDTAVDGTWQEVGAFKKGKTNHMDDLKEALDDGADVLDLMHRHFGSWVRAEKACDRYIQARDALRASTWCPPRVELHWGASGTGKTRYCMELINARYGGIAYRKPSGTWWDGYSKQECVLFDDYDGTIPLDTLLQLLDGYGRGVLLPIKGSHINCWARVFLFTSNRPLDSWYPHATEEQRAGLRRRFTLVREYRQGDPLVKVEPLEVIDLD